MLGGTVVQELPLVIQEKIFVGQNILAVDPTWNQERVDATHVKFSDSAEDMAWVNVLGKVKFKALKVEKK